MSDFVLLCDRQTVIYDAHPNALHYLRATHRNDVIGQPITRFMSKYVADIHEKHLFPSVRNADKDQLRVLINRLMNARTMSKANRYVMYTMDDTPFMCRLQIDVQLGENPTVCGFIIHVNVCRRTQASIRDTIPMEYKEFIGSDEQCIRDYDHVTCIFMDVCESTDFVRRRGGTQIAGMFRRIYEMANRCVMDLYPFVYVHELIGDSVFIIANAPFMVKNVQMQDTTLAVRVARSIQTQVDAYLQDDLGEPDMYLRVGVSVGPVTAGVIDGRTFRLFGLTVHRAQRLESVCPRGRIALDETMYHEYPDKAKIVRNQGTFKGLGIVQYYTI